MPQLGGIKQKVSVLSRRTAAEFRKAEKERSEHARRLEALEELCRQALGNLDYRLDQARVDAAQEVEKATHRVRGRLEQEMQKLAEGLERHTTEARDQRQGNSDSIRNLGKRVEGWHANLEELKSWRRETEEQLAELVARDAEERHDRLKREVAARHSDLETQVAELG